MNFEIESRDNHRKVPVGWNETAKEPPPLFVTVEVKMHSGNEPSAFVARTESGSYVFASGNLCSHPPLCWRYKE